MATIGALHTSPSASVAAMLSFPGALVQFSIYPSVPASEIELTPQATSEDDLSSPDKENSNPPTMRMEDVKNIKTVPRDACQLSPSTNQMSFTPQRVRPPPRAWERRPATPFVPRNEGQKIWKRVPLQDLSVDVNQQPHTQEKNEKDNYMRVIKRLRLDLEGHLGASEDCDRPTVASGTKWEEESIEKDGSPKKKVRAQTFGHRRSEQDTICEDNPDLEPAVPANEPEADNVAIEELPSNQSVQVDAALKLERSPDAHNHNVDCSYIVTARNIEEGLDDVCTKPSVGNSLVEVSHSGIEVIEITQNFDVNETENASVVDMTLPSQDDNAISDVASEVAKQGTLTAMAEISLDVSNNNPFPTSDKILSDPEHKDTDPTTNTHLAETSILAPTTTLLVPAQATTIFPSSDHEETAFLREFLERAQASKAARIASSPQKKSRVPPDSVAENRSFNTEMSQSEYPDPVDDIEDDDLSPPLETADIERQFPVTDANLSSPTRRSARNAARAAGSRLPRFQMPQVTQFGTTTLPGTIQLKRATGHEFVFNAKSQQTLAIMTRSNTKRNQADAVHVAQRLAQLRKEEEVRLMEAHLTEAAGLNVVKLTDQNASPLEGDVKRTHKKRKRDKQDNGKSSKARRTVTWPSDERLAFYREPSPFVNEVEASDDPEGKLINLPASVDHKLPAQAPEDIITTEPASCSKPGLKPKTKDEMEDSSKLKVRRIRKIKLDSVNGTPAPKTRSRSMVDSGSVEESANANTAALCENISTSTASSGLGTNTRKSSRMPVPISTPIPLPALTTNKPLIRKFSTDKEKSKIPASVKALDKVNSDLVLDGEKRTSTSAGATSSVPISDRRFDSRRRLRERETTQS